MKKTLKLLLTALLAVTVAFGAFACGETEPTPEPTPSLSSEVVLNQTSLDLKKGETFSLKAASATGLSITFESSNTSVATVSADGLITAVGAGEATITVRLGELSGSCTVTVTQEVVYSLSLDVTALEVGVGSQAALTAFPRKSGEDEGKTVEWTIDGESGIVTYVGSDTNTLCFTGVATGSVTVTAESDGCSATATVTVVNRATDFNQAATDQAAVKFNRKLEARLADATTNWAGSGCLDYWSVYGEQPAALSNPGMIKADQSLKGDDNSHAAIGVQFSGDVLDRVQAAGYDYARITWSTVSNSHTKLNGEHLSGVTSGTRTFAIADLESITVQLHGAWDTSGLTVSQLLFLTEEAITAEKMPLVNQGFAATDTNWATADYLDLWSATSSIAYDETEVALVVPHGGVGGTASLDKLVLAKAADQGFTHIVVKTKKILGVSNGAPNDNYSFWASVGDGAISHDTATSTEIDNGSFEGKVRLSKLLNATTEQYNVSIGVAGWWQNTHAFGITEVKFVTEDIDEQIATGIASSSTNWATADYFDFWNNDGTKAASGYSCDGGIKAAGTTGEVGLIFDSAVLSAAEEAGYNYLTVSWTSANNSHTTLCGTWLQSVTSGTKKIDISEAFAISTSGSWGNRNIVVTSLKFGKVVDDITAGLNSASTNWASADYSTFWSVDSNKNPATITYDGGIKATRATAGQNDIGLIFDPTVLTAAGTAGYTHVGVQWTSANNSHTTIAGKYLENATGGTRTIAIPQALGISTGGAWDTSAITVQSLKFIKYTELVTAGINSASINWASADYLAAWSADENNYAFYYSPKNAVAIMYGGSGYLDGGVIAAAVTKGYTKMVVTAEPFSIKDDGTYDFWFSVNSKTEAKAQASKTAPFTATIDLTDLADGDGYYVKFASAGWDNAKHAIGITSLKFTNEELIIKDKLETTQNWASEACLSYWSSTHHKAWNGTNNRIQGNGENSEGNYANLTFSSAAIAVAIQNGYTKATINISATSVSNKELFDGVTATTYKERSGGNGAAELELNLSDYTNGITYRAQGTWGGHEIYVTSLVFTKE